MPQADIEINTVASSNEDLPIDTLVQLSNNDVGDETTYDWSIVDEPPGAADALSSLVIENPTITPKKENTYLIQLIVDQGLPSESIDRKLFRVRQLKTDVVMVAVGEAVAGTQGAWAFPQNESLQKLFDQLYGGDIIVAQAGGPITAGDVVQLDEINTIKSGLPGEERIPRANLIDATDGTIVTKTVGVAVSKPNGGTAILANDIVLVRVVGFFDIAHVGTPTIGDPVFVSDSGVLSLSRGTHLKKIGAVIDDSAGAWKAFLSTLTEPAVTSDVATATATTTTTSASYVAIDSMIITPVVGTYLVWFTSTVEHSANGETINAAIFVDGSIVPSSECEFLIAAAVRTSIVCMAKVSVTGSQDIDARWKTTLATATMLERTLMMVRVHD